MSSDKAYRALHLRYYDLERELAAAKAEIAALRNFVDAIQIIIDLDNGNQGLSLMESKTLRLTSAYDEHEAREKLRKTRERLK